MRQRTLILAGAALALGLAALASPFAASAPDGLEHVAAVHGIAATEEAAWGHAALPDYQLPGVAHPGMSTGLAGAIGVIAVLAAGLVLGRLVARRHAPAA